MLEGLQQLFVDIYDSLMEPGTNALGIDHHPCTPMAGSMSESDWHNNWGTAADYQVPAESDAALESWDWSSYGGSAGGGGGSHDY